MLNHLFFFSPFLPCTLLATSSCSLPPAAVLLLLPLLCLNALYVFALSFALSVCVRARLLPLCCIHYPTEWDDEFQGELVLTLAIHNQTIHRSRLQLHTQEFFFRFLSLCLFEFLSFSFVFMCCDSYYRSLSLSTLTDCIHFPP